MSGAENSGKEMIMKHFLNINPDSDKSSCEFHQVLCRFIYIYTHVVVQTQ